METSSTMYARPFDDASSQQDTKLDPSFYTPTSFPQSNLHSLYQSQQQQAIQQQALQQQQQQEQQFFGASASFEPLMTTPSPPPLDHDMTYGLSMGMPSYPIQSENTFGDYYDGSNMYGSQAQQIPRNMQAFDMSSLRAFDFSHSSPHSASQSPHAGLLMEQQTHMPSWLPRSPPSPRDNREDDEASEIVQDSTPAEEPYAKLIHKALMQAPGHSMALQDIYRWFELNTDKANGPGSGWRNSIRHNLSMNLAFKKTDKAREGEDNPKKTSEWVLEPWAVRDGVTPTTRYRKKTTPKSSHHSSSINLSRQSAGKKGGNAAGRSRALRRMHCHNTNSPQRGSPAMSAHDDFESRNKRQCVANGEYRHTPPMEEPCTPETGMAAQPYYTAYPTPGMAYEDPEASQYSLAGVRGVYPDDGPVFMDRNSMQEKDYWGKDSMW